MADTKIELTKKQTEGVTPEEEQALLKSIPDEDADGIAEGEEYAKNAISDYLARTMEASEDKPARLAEAIGNLGKLPADQRALLTSDVYKDKPSGEQKALGIASLVGDIAKGYAEGRKQSLVPMMDKDTMALWAKFKDSKTSKNAMGTGNLNYNKFLQGEIKDFRASDSAKRYSAGVAFKQALEGMSNMKDNFMANITATYLFIKFLDPDSVVREGEIALTNSATPLAYRLKRDLEQATSGDGVAMQKIRKKMYEIAQSQLPQYLDKFDKEQKFREDVWKNEYGFSQETVDRIMNASLWKITDFNDSSVVNELARKYGFKDTKTTDKKDIVPTSRNEVDDALGF